MREPNAPRETSHPDVGLDAGSAGKPATALQADKLAKLRCAARAIAELLIQHAEAEAQPTSDAA